MAINCINTNHSDFKALVQETGANPIKLAHDIAEWQQRYNLNRFPTKDEIWSLYSNKIKSAPTESQQLALDFDSSTQEQTKSYPSFVINEGTINLDNLYDFSKIDFTQDHYVTNHVNKVLSLIAFKEFEQLKNLKLQDLANENDVKGHILKRFAGYVGTIKKEGKLTPDQLKFNLDIYNELNKPDSKLWDNFINYYSAIYNIIVTDVDSIIANRGFDEISTIWQDEAQLKENRSDSIPAKIKFRLSSIDGAVNPLTGLQEVVQLDTLVNRLISIHIGDRTNDQFLESLKIVEQEYPGLSSLINELEQDKDLLNAYISALNYDLVQTYAVVTSKLGDLSAVDYLISNRNSFIHNIEFSKWVNNLNTTLKDGSYEIVKRAKNKNVTNLTKTINDYLQTPINLKASTEQNYKALQELVDLLDAIGININVRTLTNAYDNAIAGIKSENYKDETAFNELTNSIKYILDEIDSFTKDTTEYVSDEKGNLYKLAKANSKYSNTKAALDYLNVNNDTVYTPIYQSYVGKLFKGLNTKEKVINTFEKFTKDDKFQHSNLLWGKNGIFSFDLKDGKKIIKDVNMSVVENLQHTFFNGQKNTTESMGLEYPNILNNNWDFVRIINSLDNRFFIPSSDSGRIVSLQLDFGIATMSKQDKSTLGFTMFEIKDGIVTNVDTTHIGFQLIKNTILQELTEMKRIAKMLFTPSNVVGTESNLVINERFANTPSGKIERFKLHRNKHWDGTDIVKDGKPTGRAFKFLNLTYDTTVDSRTVTHTLNDIFDNDMSYLFDETLSDRHDSLINDFIVEALTHNINKQIKHFQPIYEVLSKQSIYPRGKGLTRKQRVKKLEDNRLFKSPADFHKKAAYHYTANYLAQVEFGNFIIGNQNEYQHAIDLNKRINQAIKNGWSTLSDKTFTTITTSDIKKVTPFLDKLPKHIRGYYKGEITVSDGLSIIILDEFESRLESFGRLSDYQDVLDYFKDPTKPFNPTKFARVVESQKYFYYDRELSYDLDANNPEVLSRQYKNSTLVLSKRIAQELQLESLYDWMLANNIDSVDFKSSEKVGGDTPISIFDDNGNFVEPDTSIVDAGRHILNHSNLIIQQDVVPHLINTKNKLGVQLEKMILNNIALTGNYNVKGDDYNGQQLISHYHRLLISNIKESSLDLLREFDGVRNNEIRYAKNDDGSINEDIILVNNKKVIEYLQDYINTNEVSDTLRKAIQDDIKGIPNIPIYSSLTSKKFTSILLSLFTNNVVNQKLPGIHVPILPEIGLNPKNPKVLTDTEAFKAYRQSSKAITWINKIYDEIESGERKDFKLKIVDESTPGKSVFKVEVVVSPWFSDMYSDKGIIDINKLSEEARTSFGIRIPTEGKHSTIYLEVVGFLNTGSSQAIFPFEMVGKTGWDFDIDTAYMYMKSLTVNEDGIYTPVPYLDSNTDIQTRYDTYIQATKEGRHIKLKYSNQLSKLYDKLQRSWQNQTTRLNNLIESEQINGKVAHLNELYDIKYDLHNTLQNEVYNVEMSHTPTSKKAIDILYNDLITINKEISVLESDLGIAAVADRKSKRSDRASEIKQEIDNLNNKILEEQREQIPLEEFKKLSIEAQNTRVARMNRIIDVFSSIVSDPKHIAESYTPNKTTAIEAVGNYINGLYGYELGNLNINNDFDAAVLRNINMSVRNLKGNSVGWDGIMSALGVAGASINPVKIFIKDGSNAFAKLSKTDLNKYYDQVQTEGVAGGKIVTISHIANSKIGDWTDVNGLLISDQTSEVTANILDAVKVIMGFNINELTLPVFKLLASTSHSQVFEGKPNRFLLPYLFVHQPAIIKAINQHTIEQTIDSSVKLNNTITSIIREYTEELKHLLINDIADQFEKGFESGIMKEAIASYSKNNSYRFKHKKTYESFMDAFEKAKVKNGIFFNDYISDVSDLENNIKIYKTETESVTPQDRINYLANQIEVLRQFNQLNNTAGTIITAISTFNTDKLGAGPSFTTTRKLYNNIERLMYDRSELINILLNEEVPLEVIRNYIAEIDAAKTLQDKGALLRNILEEYNLLSYEISSLNVGNQSAVEYFYPKLFDDSLAIEDAPYPTFQSYLYYGNIAAYNTFGHLFPSETVWFDFKHKILNDNNLESNEYAESVVNDYINSIAANRMRFFRFSGNSRLNQVLNERGIDDQYSAKYENYLSIRKVANNLSDLNIDVNNPTVEDLNRFYDQSLVTKLRLLSTSKVLKDLINHPKYENNHIFDFINIEDDSVKHNNRGYSTFTVNRGGSPDFMRSSINDMLNYEGVIGDMFRITIEDMIRNHVLLHGFTFGNNILRYIDANLLYQKEGINYDDKFGLFDYAQSLRELNDHSVWNTHEYIEAFYKANWNNSLFVPLGKATKYANNRINNNKPRFIPYAIDYAESHQLVDVYYDTPLSHIIIEDATILSDSKYANKNYVTVEVEGRKVLYKRFEISEAPGNIYFYPITKTLANEVNDSIVRENEVFIIGSTAKDHIKLYTEETYRHSILENLNIFTNYDVKTITPYIDRVHETRYSSEITYDNSPIDKVIEISNNADASVYLGDQTEVFNTVLKNNNNHLHIDLSLSDNKIINLLTNHIHKHKAKNLVILGDESGNQEVLNGRISYILNKVNNHTLAYKPVIHTINRKGISNALRNNIYNIPTITYNHIKDKNILPDSKFSSEFVLDINSLTNDGSYTDASYVRSQSQVFIESLEAILQYGKEYQNIELPYKSTLTHSISDITHDQLISLLEENDISSISKTIDIHLNLLNPVAKRLREYYNDIKKNEIVNNLHTLEAPERVILGNKIRQILHMSELFDFIKDIQFIDESRGNIDVIKDINEKVKQLKDLSDELSQINDSVWSTAQNFLHGLYIIHGSNPNFKTKFTDTQQQLKDAGGYLDNNKFVEFHLDADQQVKEYAALLANNEAMTWFILNMDSVFNTGIALMDGVLREYISLRAHKNKAIDNYIDRANKLFTDYFGQSVDIKLFNNSNAITEQFINMFLENGELIAEYNWGAYYESHRKAINIRQSRTNQINEYIKQINELKEESFKYTNEEYRDKLIELESNKNALVVLRAKDSKQWDINNRVIDPSLTSLTNEQQRTILDKKSILSDDQFQKYLVKNHYIYDYKTERYIKLIPHDKYKNPKYSRLLEKGNEKHLTFYNEYKSIIQEIMDDVYDFVVVNETFLPVAYKQGGKQALKLMLGVKDIKNQPLKEGLGGEIRYDHHLPMITYRRKGYTINYDIKHEHETQAEYETRIVEEINSRNLRKDPFNTLAEIEAYNENINEENEKDLAKNRNFNPIDILSQFIHSGQEYKMMNMFDNIFQLISRQVNKNEWQEIVTSGKGTRFINKLISDAKGKKEYHTLKGSDSTAAKRLKAATNVFYDISNVHNKWDQAMSMARSTTSLAYMGANFLGAFKNAVKGYHDMLMESFARQFIDKGALNWATNEYRKSTVSFFSNVGKTYSTNLLWAIFKDNHDLLELRDVNGNILNAKDNSYKAFATFNNVVFFGMTSTEHFMQYSMLLAMMKSHRLINGIAMSYTEFLNDTREALLIPLLTTEQKEAYGKFKKVAKERFSKPTEIFDPVSRWTETAGNITTQQLKEWSKAIEVNKKEARKNFEKYETVFDQMELKNGRAEIKDGSSLTLEEKARFTDKVHKVNHTLHGVYNKIDKMALRNSATMDLAFQFRSWLKPNWDRYFGKRWGRSTYNEGLRTYQKGVYTSAYQFLTRPIRTNKIYGKDDRTTLEALKNLLTHYADFFTNARYYYRILPEHEQANIWRATTNFIGMITTSFLLLALGKLAGDKDDERKAIENQLLALSIYELNMIHSEITQFVPGLGWHGFYQRSKQYPLAAEKVLVDMINLTNTLIKYPFQDDEDRRYQAGPYKGRTRLDVQSKRFIPIYRQIHKWEQLGMYTGWYKMYNPLSFMFGS